MLLTNSQFCGIINTLSNPVRFDLSTYFSLPETPWIAKHNTGQLGGLNYLETVMDTRICNKCGIEKSLDDFYLHKECKGGRLSICKGCVRLHASEYRQSPEGRERKRLYEQSPEGIAKRLAREQRPERKEYQKKYKQTPEYRANAKAHRDSPEGKAVTMAYQQSSAFKASNARNHHRRRLLMENLPCDLTAEQWEDIKASQNYKCAMCGEEKSLHRDHIIPVTKGGAFTKSNIQGLCKSCNSSKNNRIIEEEYNMIELELHSCLVCSGHPDIICYFIKGVANHVNYFAKCSCGIRTRSRRKYDGAVQDWNILNTLIGSQDICTELLEGL
jgi:5-methylcytosine-specific restriction endonuclease McrA